MWEFLLDKYIKNDVVEYQQKLLSSLEGQRLELNAKPVFGTEAKSGPFMRWVLIKDTKVPEAHTKGEATETLKTPAERCTHGHENL